MWFASDPRPSRRPGRPERAKPLILAGDIGGTKSNLALFEQAGAGRVGTPQAEASFPTSDFPSFAALLEAYRSRNGAALSGAAFGVAGPVAEGRVQGTNLPWVIEATVAARELGLKRVGLVNDLVATGYAIPALDPRDLETLQPGQRSLDGNVGLIAAGTGLGEATLARLGNDWIPVASEGGHADFAPRTDEELDLFRELRARYGRVSYERVLSGPGIVDLARWAHERSGNTGGWVEHEMQGADEDLAGIASRAAMDGSCADCGRALRIFSAAYGAEAGNLALRGVTSGGIYVGGGIAPKILLLLRGGAFVDAFRDKEPHRELLFKIPIHVIRNERAAVLGAARYASLGI